MYLVLEVVHLIFSIQCPKCNNSEIAGPHRIHADRSHSKIDLPGFSTATLEAYTCTQCGYTEFYVDQGGRVNMKQSGRFLYHSSGIQPSSYWSTCPTCGASVLEKTDCCNHCGGKLE